MLVDVEKFKALLAAEEEAIDIRGAAAKLRKLKNFMGPVTVVWADYVLEAAKDSQLTNEEKKRLVWYMERDIRRAVKKDKGDIIYGVIAAFFAEVAPDKENFRDAIEMVESLGIDSRLLNLACHRIRQTTDRVLFVLRVVAKKAEPELYELLSKLERLLRRTNYFERFGRRKLERIVQRLGTVKKLFVDNETVERLLCIAAKRKTAEQSVQQEEINSVEKEG